MKSYRIEVRGAVREDNKQFDLNLLVTWGTAWPITSDIVVTAFHVLGNKWLNDIDDISYWLIVDLENNDCDVELEFATCDQYADVALLRRKHSACEHGAGSWQQLPIGEWGVNIHARWSAPGFAAVAGRSRQTLTGTIASNSPHANESAFELFVAQGNDVSWEGASGSPICVDGFVIGILITEVVDASTLRASSVESALRLLRVYQETELQEYFRSIITDHPESQLRDLAKVFSLDYTNKTKVPELVHAIVSRAIRHGAKEMLAILTTLPNKEEIQDLKRKIIELALKPERSRWPRRMTTVDDRWERHPECKRPALLEDAWQLFLQREPWDQYLNKQLKKVITALSKTDADKGLIRQFVRFSNGRSYEMMRMDITHLHGRADLGIKNSSSNERELRLLRGRLDRLKRLINERTPLGRCFFLMGSSGSGKTHFIETILAEEPQNFASPLVLPVYLPKLESFTKIAVECAILDALHTATDRRFESLNEFQNALNVLKKSHEGFLMSKNLLAPQSIEAPRLVIAFDNLNHFMSGGEIALELCKILQEIIKESTSLPAVYWLVTVQDTFYDRLLIPQKSPNFWEKYSCVASFGEQPDGSRPTLSQQTIPAKAGWIDLDQIVLANKVGFDILQLKFGEAWLNNSLANNHKNNRQPAIVRYIQLPWFAWVFQSLGEEWCTEAIKTGDLNYIRIAEELISARILTLGASNEHREVIQRYILIIAAALVPCDGERLYNLAFKKDVMRLAKEASFSFKTETLESQMHMLRSSSLLKLVKQELKESLEADFVMVWGYEGAKYLYDILISKDIDLLIQRLETDLGSKPSDKLFLKESALEFLLLIVDQKQANLVDMIVRKVFASKTLGDAAISFAAPKLSVPVQQKIYEISQFQASVSDVSITNPRILLAKIIFMERAAPDALLPKQRLEFLRTEYKCMHEYGFSTYYFAVAAKILDEVQDVQMLIDCMHALRGCELVGLAEHLAERAIARLFDIFKNTYDEQELVIKILPELLGYINDGCQYAEQDYVGHDKNKKWERKFFREWVLRAFCFRLVSILGPTKTFEFLDENNWFRTSSKMVKIEMARESNIAIGRYFHLKEYLFNQAEGEGATFIKLVGAMVDSREPADREYAFHLIRHTRPTNGEYNVLISKKFHQFLLTLSKDKRLLRKGNFVGLYTENIGSSPNLRK